VQDTCENQSRGGFRSLQLVACLGSDLEKRACLNPLGVTVARELVCRLRVALSDTFKVSILSISLCVVLSPLDQLRSTLRLCTKYPPS
jgi:hypothetical protein